MKAVMTQENINTIAKEVLDKAKGLKSESATVIALSGELGSGKTTLTQEIAKILSVKENIISPTFVIMKGYIIKDIAFKNLIHIDAYRLKNSSELFKLGFQELLADKNNLIIVEWPEQVRECIPENALWVELTHEKEGERGIEVKA